MGERSARAPLAHVDVNPSSSRLKNKGRCNMVKSLEDVKSALFWRAVAAECVGTCILVLLGTGSCTGWEEEYSPSIVQIALTFGLTVAVMIWVIGGCSGCHINPAVSMALLLTRKVSIIRGLLFIAAQCTGGILGSAFLMGITPPQHRGTLGSTAVNAALSPAQGFGVEFLLTFVLVITVFAVVDEKREQAEYAPFAIGLAVVVVNLMGIKYTGCSVNPARSLGPAVCTGIWTNHWVYWCGPLLGGFAAGLVYDNIFAANASFKKTRDYMLSANYNNENYQERKEEFIRVEEKDRESGF